MRSSSSFLLGAVVAVVGCSSAGQYSAATSTAIERCEQAAEADGHIVHAVAHASSHGDGSAEVVFEATARDGGDPYQVTCNEDAATEELTITRQGEPE